MARYRKVEVKTWNDERFRRLTPIPPCGQGLWLWLLTGQRSTNIPGVVIGTDVVMAAELRWPIEAFLKAFDEAFRQGMAKACWEAGLVWLPNATKIGESRNKPESPNVVKSWRDTWDEIPECVLKLEVWQHLKSFTEAFGEGFGKAFIEGCRQPSPNQEQEQNQEQNQNQEKRERDARAPDVPRGSVVEAAFGSLLEDWRRDVPEANPAAFAKWIVHCEERGKQMTPSMRLAQAKRLSGEGDFATQSGIVDYCCENGFKTLIPKADYLHRTQGRAANGRQHTPAPTTAELEAREAARGGR